MNQLNHKEKTQRWQNRAMRTTVAIAVIVVGAYVFFFWENKLSQEPEDWARFGDYFGGLLNPIVSMVAVFVLIKTFQLQIQEFKQSSEELRKSSEALNEQNKLQAKRSFDGMLFQLLELHNHNVSNLRINITDYGDGGSHPLKTGHECFNYLQLRCTRLPNYNSILVNYPDCIQKFKEVYNDFFTEHKLILWHYFERVFVILKFIKNKHIDDLNFYKELIHSQFTLDELELLFYHGLSNHATSEFKSLIEEFQMFKNLFFMENPHLDKLSKNLAKGYKPIAFGGTYPDYSS